MTTNYGYQVRHSKCVFLKILFTLFQQMKHEMFSKFLWKNSAPGMWCLLLIAAVKSCLKWDHWVRTGPHDCTLRPPVIKTGYKRDLRAMFTCFKSDNQIVVNGIVLSSYLGHTEVRKAAAEGWNQDLNSSRQWNRILSDLDMQHQNDVTIIGVMCFLGALF